MLPQVTKLKRMALNLLFPQWCIGCGREGDYICSSCHQSLLPITPPICSKCGRPESGGGLCPRCVNWQAEIDGVRSPFIFGGLMRQVIHELKYRNLRAVAKPLAKLLHDYLITNPVPGDILVPVPLHQKRLRERGYNQSSLLAQELSKLNSWPIADDCLIRHRQAPPQARTASAIGRQDNVADAFTCIDGRLQGKRVLLIDDVSTSGATLNACAVALKSTGVTSVWGLVMAKEI